MMYGHEKSDSVIVAVKPTNKTERSAAELVEPRTETKGGSSLRRRKANEHIRKRFEKLKIRP
jgi:hypothetical protein